MKSVDEKFSKHLTVWSWIMVVIVIVLLASCATTKEEIGTDIEISVQFAHDLRIEGDEIYFEAQSSGPFSFGKKYGEPLEGIQKTPPLGWPDDEYYVIEKQQISEGKWVFDGWKMTSGITSSEEITVTRLPEDNAWAFLIILSLAIWAFGGVCIFIV